MVLRSSFYLLSRKKFHIKNWSSPFSFRMRFRAASGPINAWRIYILSLGDHWSTSSFDGMHPRWQSSWGQHGAPIHFITWWPLVNIIVWWNASQIAKFMGPIWGPYTFYHLVTIGQHHRLMECIPDSKVHGSNMGPLYILSLGDHWSTSSFDGMHPR